MITIQNVRYQMTLRGGGDRWQIYGNVIGHPAGNDGELMCPSYPTEFDETNLTFKTISGNEYKIESFLDGSDIEKDKFIAQIKKDIAKGGYEVH